MSWRLPDELGEGGSALICVLRLATKVDGSLGLILIPGSGFVVVVGIVTGSGGVMISRYLVIYKSIESCIEDVPSVSCFSGAVCSSSSGISTQSSDDNGDGCSGL